MATTLNQDLFQATLAEFYFGSFFKDFVFPTFDWKKSKPFRGDKLGGNSSKKNELGTSLAD